MKKLLATVAIGGALVFGGFFFADNPVDTTTGELEPPILRTLNFEQAL